MSLLACRTFATLALALALASPSRLRAPNTVRSLTATASAAFNKKPPRAKATRPPRSPRSPRPHLSTTKAKASSVAANSAEHSRSAVLRSGSSAVEAPHDGKRQRSLLQPYELSGRLIKLCEGGDVDLAITTLKSAPRNAQNIKVWNTLIQKCMDAKKYKLAYSVFTDMKRRGFVPNVRTYATMMSGYATIEDWGRCQKQLGLVHSVYGQLKQHLKNPRTVLDEPSGSPGISFILYPIALYISVLGRAGKYQRAFDVFHKLDIDGPLAPHPKVYSSLLCVLADQVDPMDAPPEVIAQSVSDAKYVWRRQIRSADKNPDHSIEPRSVDAMIKVLSLGEPTDHELMFDILHDICGLPRPAEDLASSPTPSLAPSPAPSSSPSPPPPPPPKVAPTAWILSETLHGCIAAGHPDKAVHYAQSVMSARELRSILRPWHLHKLLVAHNLLAKEGSTSPTRSESAAEWMEWMVAQARDGRVVLPNELSLALACELCYLCGDVHSALRIARAVLEGPVRGSMPVRAWAHLLRLAIVAPPEEKRQCLELLNTHGSVLNVWASSSAVGRLTPPEKRSHVSLALCIIQVLRTVPPSSDHDSLEGLDASNLEQHKAWSDLRRRAESFLEKHK